MTHEGHSRSPAKVTDTLKHTEESMVGSLFYWNSTSDVDFTLWSSVACHAVSACQILSISPSQISPKLYFWPLKTLVCLSVFFLCYGPYCLIRIIVECVRIICHLRDDLH